MIGNDTAITVAGMQGKFELNVRVPLIARNLLAVDPTCSTSAATPARREVRGRDRGQRGECLRHAESTPAIATALNAHIGYDKATEIVKEAVASRRTIREVAHEKGVDEATLDKALDLRAMVRGGNI